MRFVISARVISAWGVLSSLVCAIALVSASILSVELPILDRVGGERNPTESSIEDAGAVTIGSGTTAHALQTSLRTSPCTLAEERIVLRPDMSMASQMGESGPHSGTIEAGEEWCRGHVPEEPTFCLEVVESGEYELKVTEGSDDPVMMLVELNSSDIRCDDDSGGNLMPALKASLTRGYYELYVGSYGEYEGGRARVTIRSVGGSF